MYVNLTRTRLRARREPVTPFDRILSRKLDDVSTSQELYTQATVAMKQPDLRDLISANWCVVTLHRIDGWLS